MSRRSPPSRRSSCTTGILSPRAWRRPSRKPGRSSGTRDSPRTCWISEGLVAPAGGADICRAVRRRQDIPQILVGHGFGGLIVLRYLETQPGEPPAAAVVACPWLASRVRPAVWKRLAARLADLWPTLPTGRGAAYMTAGARAELQWAQRAVVADCQRIERPLLLLLGESDEVIDASAVRGLADQLGSRATVLAYPALGHDLLTDRGVRRELSGFIAEFRSLGHHPRIA